MKFILSAFIVGLLVLAAPATFAQTMNSGSTSAAGAGVNKDDQGMSKGKTHAAKHKKKKHAKNMSSKPMDYSGSTSKPGAGVDKDDSKKK